MRRSFTYSLLFYFLVIMCSCEKEYDWDIKSNRMDILVVDGIITNEHIAHCVRLSFTNQDLNMNSRAVSGATVFVTADTNSYEFVESPNDTGCYYASPFQAVVERQYHLMIEYDSQTYEAVGEAVPVTPLKDPVFEGNAENDLQRYVFTESGQPSMLEVYYDWSEIPDYCTEYGYCQAQETFCNLDNIDVNNIYAPPRQIIWFPAGTSIIRKKYGLSEDHQAFLRSLLMETEWCGGIFDVQHGNVPTNLSNGAIGYFAVCMVVSDTLYIN